jgi:hypothetical protein
LKNEGALLNRLTLCLFVSVAKEVYTYPPLLVYFTLTIKVEFNVERFGLLSITSLVDFCQIFLKLASSIFVHACNVTAIHN